MRASGSKHVNLPIIGKARTEHFSQSKSSTYGEVLQRFTYHFKVFILGKNKTTNVTCVEVVDSKKASEYIEP